MNNYTLTASNITATSVTITLTHTSGNAPVDTPIIIVSLGSTEVSRQSIDESLIDTAGESAPANFSNLTPLTTYTASLNSGDGVASNITFTTLATPTKFVQLQNKAGEDIYPIVPDGGKAIIEVTDTDPGEGVPLQENHFIAVYGDATRIQTNDIADGAVTSDKIDWTTLGGVYGYATSTTYTADSAMCSITIPKNGIYLVSAFARGYYSASVGSSIVNLYLTKNGTSLGNAMFNVYSDGTGRVANAVVRADSFATGDVVALRSNTDMTLTKEVCNISAIRIK